MNLEIEIIGLIAGAITSIGFTPQIIRGYKTKKLDDVSIFMPLILAIGMTLWLFYGILLNAYAVIAANLFGVGCCITLLALKKVYSRVA